MSTTTFTAKPLIRLWTDTDAPPAGRRPLVYSIDRTLGVIFIDLLTIDDAPALVLALQRLRLDPSFDRALNACIDCRYLSRAPDADDIHAIAALWPRGATRSLTGRCAIVASSPWVLSGARTFAALAGGGADRIRVFGACAEALVWLGLGRQQPA